MALSIAAIAPQPSPVKGRECQAGWAGESSPGRRLPSWQWPLWPCQATSLVWSKCAEVLAPFQSWKLRTTRANATPLLAAQTHSRETRQKAPQVGRGESFKSATCHHLSPRNGHHPLSTCSVWHWPVATACYLISLRQVGTVACFIDEKGRFTELVSCSGSLSQ